MPEFGLLGLGRRARVSPHNWMQGIAASPVPPPLSFAKFFLQDAGLYYEMRWIGNHIVEFYAKGNYFVLLNPRGMRFL